jgi:hypothetical protein
VPIFLAVNGNGTFDDRWPLFCQQCPAVKCGSKTGGLLDEMIGRGEAKFLGIPPVMAAVDVLVRSRMVNYRVFGP